MRSNDAILGCTPDSYEMKSMHGRGMGTAGKGYVVDLSGSEKRMWCDVAKHSLGSGNRTGLSYTSRWQTLMSGVFD